MNATVRKAAVSDADTVTGIYRLLVGSEGCVWNEYYPSADDVVNDIKAGALYVICSGDGDIVGAAAAGDDNELGELDCWSADVRHPCELARVGIRPDCQHLGLAGQLVAFIERDAQKRGYDGIRLLASTRNIKAVALYRRLSYREAGNAEMFGNGEYICFEKKLNGTD